MSPEELSVLISQNTQASVVSVYRADICSMKKRLQIIFCVLHHLNTYYWNHWSFKEDLDICFTFRKHYSVMIVRIQRWHCTDTLPWNREQGGINGDKKNIILLSTLPHSSPTPQRVQSCLLVHSWRRLWSLTCFCPSRPLPCGPGGVSTEHCFKQISPAQLYSSSWLPSKLSFTSVTQSLVVLNPYS